MAATEAPIATDASAETLARLARFHSYDQPVLSIYVDLDPARLAARASQLGSLLVQARRQGAAREAHWIAAWHDSESGTAPSAATLAMFACTEAELFEVVRMPTAIEPLSVVDTIPWLEPLAASISPGDWGVAVVGRRRARLLRGVPEDLSEFAVLDDDAHRRHAQGGRSQARLKRSGEQQVAARIRGVSERLRRAHRRAPFAHLVFVCAGELRPAVEEGLPGELRAALSAIVDADLEHASVEEIARAVAATSQAIEPGGKVSSTPAA